MTRYQPTGLEPLTRAVLELLKRVSPSGVANYTVQRDSGMPTKVTVTVYGDQIFNQFGAEPAPDPDASEGAEVCNYAWGAGDLHFCQKESGHPSPYHRCGCTISA